MQDFIPVASPKLGEAERRYVLDCIDSGWISSAGSYVKRFEEEYAAKLGVEHAISCCNGTAALHLGLLALGVEPGDEILLPSFTYVATANAIAYCGARPIFLDSDVCSWNLDPACIAARIT